MSDLITISKSDFETALQLAVQKGIQAERGRMTDLWITEFDFRMEWKNPNNGKPLSKNTLNLWIAKFGLITRQLGDRRQILRSSIDKALKQHIVFNRIKKTA